MMEAFPHAGSVEALRQQGGIVMAAKTDTVTNVTEPATKSYEQTVAALKSDVAQATAGFEQTQAKVKENIDKASKTAAEAMAFSQGNLEALTRSGQIWSAGMQDLSRQFAATAQASFDETMNRLKALASVKTLKDAIELQSSLLHELAEKAVAETSRLTTASIKLTEEAMAPITARVSLAVETFTKTG